MPPHPGFFYTDSSSSLTKESITRAEFPGILKPPSAQIRQFCSIVEQMRIAGRRILVQALQRVGLGRQGKRVALAASVLLVAQCSLVAIWGITLFVGDHWVAVFKALRLT